MLKTMNTAKKIVLAILLVIMTLSLAVGCSTNTEGSKGQYTVPAETTIDAGLLYTPDFELPAGMSAEVVEFTTPSSSKTRLDGLAFTPDITGTYKYTVLFTHEATGNQWVETILPVFPTLKRLLRSTSSSITLKSTASRTGLKLNLWLKKSPFGEIPNL